MIDPNNFDALDPIDALSGEYVLLSSPVLFTDDNISVPSKILTGENISLNNQSFEKYKLLPKKVNPVELFGFQNSKQGVSSIETFFISYIL